MIVFCNGTYLPEEQCLVSPFDDGFMLGQGLFETVRVYAGRPEFLPAHLHRLMDGAEQMGLCLPDISIAHIAGELIRKNRFMGTGRLKIVVYKRRERFAGVIGQLKSYRSPELVLYQNGVDLGNGQHPKNGPLARVKALDWHAFKLACQPGVFETLLFSAQSHALEGSRTNFFLLNGDAVLFPPRGGRLYGVMETRLRQQLQNAGIPFSEKEISSREIHLADALFICNSLIGVMPVRKFDDQKMKQNVSLKIRKIIRQFQDTYENKKAY